MNRRQLLKLLTSGVVGLASDTIDIDRLLWVPNQKTIFLPTPHKVEVIGRPLTLEMIEETLKAIQIRSVHNLFERDDVFYRQIRQRETIRVSAREMRIPLILKPGNE